MRWIFLALGIAILSANFTFAAAPLPIYLSQIQITGGAGKTEQDFVELYNPRGERVNLKGYRLVKRAGNAEADSTIKVWSNDAFIPARGFYLWANSGYASIASKPDITTSAALSGDSGVALRFGQSNTGIIMDSALWGKASNGFRLVSSQTPGAGQALVREDLSAAASKFYIAQSRPRNSLSADVSISAPLEADMPQKPSGKVLSAAAPKKTNISQPAKTSEPIAAPPSQSSEIAVNNAEAQKNPQVFEPQAASKNTKTEGFGYLGLAGAALAVLGFIAWKFVFAKKP